MATPGAPTITRLTKRQEFLRVARHGKKCVAHTMVLQTAPRVCATEAPSMIAVGFTATKKLGGAVVRNRIKRRLRAAVDTVMPDAAHAGHDYVLIGRKAALNAPFEKICKDLQWALRKLHA